MIRPSFQRRRWLKQVAVWAALPGGLSLVLSDTLANAESPIKAGMNRMSGDVRVNGAPARLGMLIKPGDTVRTGPGAEAVYVIDQDAYLQRSNSEVNFPLDATTQFMRVVSGKLLSVFGKRERTRHIATTTATIGIRGTGCYIEDEPYPSMRPNDSRGDTAPVSIATRRTYFCLCYGTVDLVPTAAPTEGETYTTRHHDHPLYVTNDPAMPTKMVPAEVKNHSDAELTLLENLVGRRTPFAGREGNYAGG